MSVLRTGLVVAALTVAALVFRAERSGTHNAPISPGSDGGQPPVAIPVPSPDATPTQHPAPRLLRNPFGYREIEPPAPRLRPRPTVQPTPQPAATSTATPSAPLRFVGIVRRSGRLLAAISLFGDVAVVAAGESVGDYRVLSVDEETVRLVGPDGEVSLAAQR